MKDSNSGEKYSKESSVCRSKGERGRSMRDKKAQIF